MSLPGVFDGCRRFSGKRKRRQSRPARGGDLGAAVRVLLCGRGPDYGEFEVTVEIGSGAVNGDMPKRALAHVQEWRSLHQQELHETWTLARASRPLPRIEPLE